MLKDAALLQLELLLGALDEGLTLKDATPYNVQWRGAHPVFVDIGSFERLREGEPWAGYRQFCMLYLYPLMLQAWKDVPFQPWLRGSLDGIEPAAARNLLSARDRFRRGVLGHVVLHSRLERRYGDRRRDVKRELESAGFHTGLIRANVEGLRRLVRRLSWDPGADRVVRVRRGQPLLGGGRAGEGGVRPRRHRRSPLAARLGSRLQRRPLHARGGRERATTWSPSTVTPASPSCSTARSGGRLTLDPPPHDGRGRPLSQPGLAGARAPRARRAAAAPSSCSAWRSSIMSPSRATCRSSSFLEWLAGLEPVLVIEFPTRDDPMVQRLLAAKGPTANPDYDDDAFERALARHWRIERRETLPSGTRILYRAVPGA